jgi:hypothetical protein
VAVARKATRFGALAPRRPPAVEGAVELGARARFGQRTDAQDQHREQQRAHEQAQHHGAPVAEQVEQFLAHHGPDRLHADRPLFGADQLDEGVLEVLLAAQLAQLVRAALRRHLALGDDHDVITEQRRPPA